MESFRLATIDGIGVIAAAFSAIAGEADVIEVLAPDGRLRARHKPKGYDGTTRKVKLPC